MRVDETAKTARLYRSEDAISDDESQYAVPDKIFKLDFPKYVLVQKGCGLLVGRLRQFAWRVRTDKAEMPAACAADVENDGARSGGVSLAETNLSNALPYAIPNTCDAGYSFHLYWQLRARHTCKQVTSFGRWIAEGPQHVAARSDLQLHGSISRRIMILVLYLTTTIQLN